MDYATMPAAQNVQGSESENPSQNQKGTGQSQSIGGMEQEMDFNASKQGYGSNTLKPLTDNNNNRNEMPEFGSDEKNLDKDKDDDGPVNPEIPDEGDLTPKPDPITF